MALDWLFGAANLLRGIGGARAQFRGLQETQGEKFSSQMRGAQHSLADQILQLSRGQYDVNDPLYKQFYEEERGFAKRDLADAINQLTTQNRRLSAMGRTPLFAPERRGEMAFRALSRGYEDAQQSARSRARERLGIGQQAVAQGFDAFGNLAQGGMNQSVLQTLRQRTNQAGQLGGIGSIADMLQSLSGRGRYY